MTDNPFAFLSYSRNDRQPAGALQKQLEQAGLAVFRDDAIPCSARWLNVLQEQVESCSRFVVLVGCDGVRRWMGAEASVALFRHIDPQRDEDRLPIFPILLGENPPEVLPGFLRQFQAIRWNGSAPFEPADLERICEKPGFDGPGIGIDVPPFVGLDAFQPEQSRLFFGRQRETLELLDCLGRRSDPLPRRPASAASQPPPSRTISGALAPDPAAEQPADLVVAGVALALLQHPRHDQAFLRGDRVLATEPRAASHIVADVVSNSERPLRFESWVTVGRPIQVR